MKRTYTYTPEELEKKVRQYFQDCEEDNGSFPDESGMLNFLDISDTEYEALKRSRGHGRILIWAKRRRMSWLERHMVEGSKAATGCMNALKQEKNGGYTNQAAPEKKDKKLIVKIEGLTPGGLK